MHMARHKRLRSVQNKQCDTGGLSQTAIRFLELLPSGQIINAAVCGGECTCVFFCSVKATDFLVAGKRRQTEGPDRAGGRGT